MKPLRTMLDTDLDAPRHTPLAEPPDHTDTAASEAVTEVPAETGPRAAAAGPLTRLSALRDETHMAPTIGALRERGLDARPWRPWEDPLEGFDVLHLFGTVPEHLALMDAARRQGMPVVLSPMSWLTREDTLPGADAWWARWMAAGEYTLRRLRARLPSWQRQLYRGVDLLLPNSHAEAHQLMHYHGVPVQRIHITPGGADPRWAEADAESFVRLIGTDRFVLCSGPIEPRNNQLGLLRAVQGADVPVVLLGDVEPKCEDYLEACRRAGGEQMIHVPAMAYDDPMLASAYAAAGCVVVRRWQPTSIVMTLNAAMTGCPLILPRHAPADEYFGELATYIPAADDMALRRAVLRVIGTGRSPLLSAHVRHYLTWHTTAEITCEAYAKVIAAE